MATFRNMLQFKSPILCGDSRGLGAGNTNTYPGRIGDWKIVWAGKNNSSNYVAQGFRGSNCAVLQDHRCGLLCGQINGKTGGFAIIEGPNKGVHAWSQVADPEASFFIEISNNVAVVDRNH